MNRVGVNQSIGNLIGTIPTETASIAYDGTLLPTGTALYEIKLKEIL